MSSEWVFLFFKLEKFPPEIKEFFFEKISSFLRWGARKFRFLKYKKFFREKKI